MNLSNLTYNNLMYFSVVFEERNLSKAAERISISRQALSKSISSLEHNLEKYYLSEGKMEWSQPRMPSNSFHMWKQFLKNTIKFPNRGKWNRWPNGALPYIRLMKSRRYFPIRFMKIFWSISWYYSDHRRAKWKLRHTAASYQQLRFCHRI